MDLLSGSIGSTIFTLKATVDEAFQVFKKAYAKKTAPHEKHYYEAAQAAHEEFFVVKNRKNVFPQGFTRCHLNINFKG